MWNGIWAAYVKDWKAHSKEELFIQVMSIIFILIIGMIAIRIIGKKSVGQMTLTNVLFIFVLSSTLGALITKPNRVLIALLVVVTIVIFVWILEKLQIKMNFFEKILFSYPSVVYTNNQYQKDQLLRNSLTIDQLESLVRQQGYPSIEICKTIVLEPSGNLSIELLPEYEPIRKMEFEAAVQQILKAVGDEKYIEPIPDIKNNLFEEAVKKRNKKDNQELE